MKNIVCILKTFALAVALTTAGPAVWAAVTGSGTQNDPYVVDNWADLKAKMAAGGYIRLGANVTGDSYLEVPAGVSVTLDLNGKALQRTVQAGNVIDETGYVIKVTSSNSTLTITDNATVCAGTISGGNALKGGAFYVDTGSTLIMNGGVIANCQADFGSAIYNLGTLTINGGTIQNCTATSGLGQGTIYNNGTLTINGGVIQNNTAFYGGAIYNSNGWSTTINGGTIQNNSAIHTYYNNEDGIGGGIVNFGILYLYGGTIQGNSCDREGGGIYNNYYIGVKGNPVVIGNTKESENNNVYLPNGIFINLVGNLTEAARIGVSPETYDNIITTGLPGKGTKANFAFDNSDGYELIINGQGELSADVAYTITVPENVTVIGLAPKAANTYQEVFGNVVTLSATGYVITSATYNDGSDHVIDPVQGVFSFTMPSRNVTVSAVLIVNKWIALQTRLTNASTNADSPTLITLTEDIVASDGDSYLSIPAGHHAIIDLNGHTIDRNMTESRQGGYVILLNGQSNNHASLTICDTQGGGQITGGFDGTAGGGSAAGGINVQYGDLTLESGSICGNKCTFGGGGGVRVAGGTFTMTGGSITGNMVNTLKNSSARAGGAIYGISGDIYLRGGSITDNTTYGSSYACGGIAHDYANSAAQLHLSGTFTLSDNRKLSYDTNTHDWTTVVGSDYLHGNREYIILDGPINPTEPIAIELYSGNNGYHKRLTTNWDTHMGTAEADGLFTLVDNTESNGMLIGVKDGNVQICTPEEVYWHIDANHDGSSEEKAYIITTAEGLDLLAKHVNGTDGYTANNFLNKYFRLGKDITYTHKAANDAGADTENNFTAIGTAERPFSGYFDGAGHTISGIRIYQPYRDYQGLFGWCPHDVKNVILCDAVITGQNYVGGIAGRCGSHTENCIVRDAIITGKDYVGGIGGGDQGTYGLKFCFVERTNVVGVGDHAGAIVGYYPDNANALQYNYYHSCTRNTRNNTVSIGIGTGDGDSYDMYHGADAVFTITTADPISITAIEACRYQDVNYYYSVIGVTISAPGYTILSASYNDGSSDHTITPNGGVYTFSMPSSDITISASLTVNATQDITAYAGTVSGVTGYWATFYSGSLDYRLPAGAQAFTMDSNHHLYRLGTDGSIIPKNTAVILLSDTAAITLTKIDDSPTVTDNAPNGNILRAGPVTVMQGKVDGQYVYVLGIIDVNPTVIGFGRYMGPIIPANKAYYLSAE